MPANIVVFDIETKRSFDEVGGARNMAQLGISLLGAYDYSTNQYTSYLENELGSFLERLAKRPKLIGFNSKKFDIPVLQPYAGDFNLSEIPHLDLMEELTNVLGHRVSLQSVATATVGAGKSGSGLDALKYFKEGDFESLRKYCLDDVRLTMEVYEYGANHGEVFYTPKFGSGKARAPINWPKPEDSKPPSQFDLF